MTTKPAIQTHGRRLLRTGLRPDEVLETLRRSFPATEIPSLRTVQRWQSAVENDEVMWSFRDADPADAVGVLAALRAVAVESGGRVVSISERHADAIARLCRTAPGIPPIEAYLLAGDYLDSPPAFLSNLDLYLAFEGWSEAGHRNLMELAATGDNWRLLQGVPLRPGAFEALIGGMDDEPQG